MFQIAKEKCDQCLFSKNRIVRKGRMQEILRQCQRTDGHFVCHKFSIEDPDSKVCCAGFYEYNPYATNLMRIAERLNAIKFVPIPDEPSEQPLFATEEREKE